jgi:hypothetical protein
VRKNSSSNITNYPALSCKEENAKESHVPKSIPLNLPSETYLALKSEDKNFPDLDNTASLILYNSLSR